MDYNNFIAIGKIVRTIGIKGNLKIIPMTDFPDRFYSIKKLYLFDEKKKNFVVNSIFGNNEFFITDCRVFDKYINLKLDNFDNIESSAGLVNLIVMIDEKDRVKLQDGSYYYYELIDSGVFDNGRLIGNVISVLNYGNDDLFNVNYKGKEILIPFNKEFVRKIDLKKKRIDVELIDGFLD